MLAFRKQGEAMNRLSTKPKPLSLDAFNDLLADAPENERWELVGGHVVGMTVGARLEHARIVSNLNGELRNRLRATGSACWAFAETFRLETDQASLLPDIAVNCTPLPVGATKFRTPSVIMEVLSDSTTDRDRGDKWSAYRTIASLQHYALVRCDTPWIDVYDRSENGAWASMRTIVGLDASIDLPAIHVAIPFSEIYFGVLT